MTIIKSYSYRKIEAKNKGGLGSNPLDTKPESGPISFKSPNTLDATDNAMNIAKYRAIVDYLKAKGMSVVQAMNDIEATAKANPQYQVMLDAVRWKAPSSKEKINVSPLEPGGVESPIELSETEPNKSQESPPSFLKRTLNKPLPAAPKRYVPQRLRPENQ